MGFDPKEWALSWLKGSIISYMKGKISSVMLFGRIRRCIKSYGVSVAEVKALINVVAMDPSLNLGPPEEKRKKLDLLLKFLDEEFPGVR